MGTVLVRVNFTIANPPTGESGYNLPHVFSISDPIEGIKGTLIEGNRASGSIYIASGKKSEDITIKGNLIGTDYTSLAALIDTMRVELTTEVGTLTLESFVSGSWVPQWSHVVRRIEKINFTESLRIDYQEYEVTWKILSY